MQQNASLLEREERIKLNLPDNRLKSHLSACNENYKSSCLEFSQIHLSREMGGCGSGLVGDGWWVSGEMEMHSAWGPWGPGDPDQVTGHLA